MNWLTLKAKVIAVVLAIVGALGLLKLKERRDVNTGVDKEAQRQKEIDHEKAKDIRDAAAGVGVRPDDELVFRDDESDL